MRKIAWVLILLLIPIVLAMSTVNTVHAAIMTGTFSLNVVEAGASTLPNGTNVYYANYSIVYQGAFSGTSHGNDTEYQHPDGSGTLHAVENFTGSFNASQQGALTFQDFGYFLGYGKAGYWAASFSGGTGGLARLQGTLTAQYPSGNCIEQSGIQACAIKGTYTVTSATWASPAPEFSDITLPIVVLFTTAVSLVVLRRKEN